MNKIAIITPTRGRQEQLALVIDCVNNQTRRPDEWIIVDDGPEPVDQEIIDRIQVPHIYTHYKSNLKSSTSLNSAKCLKEANADKYIFFDDDDYYPKNYIEEFDKIIVNNNEMIGNSRWIDYRLSTGYYRIRLKTEEQIKNGDTFCEWHGSAIMGEELKQEMINILLKNPQEKYNDHLCYKNIFLPKKYICRIHDFREWSAISLKDYGVGTAGAIESHRSNNGMIKDDDNYSFFKEKLGEDWGKYKKYLGRLR